MLNYMKLPGTNRHENIFNSKNSTATSEIEPGAF